MNSADSQANLYERIGAADGVASLIYRFYEKVLADANLRAHFAHVEMDKLRHMQYEFFAAALDGPIRYSGRPVIHAHHGRHITREHLQAFVEHLFQTLKEYALTDDERYAIIARINIYADDVIGDGVGLDT